MNKKFIIEVLKASLENRTIEWKEKVSEEEWNALFQFAFEQNILPMVYESIYKSDAYLESGCPAKSMLRSQVQQKVVLQIMRTNEFLEMYKQLSAEGLTPIVVKGIVCRELYPNPDARLSNDEDMYIPQGTFEDYHEALAHAGMEIGEWDVPNVELLHEVSYVKKGGVLKIEIHKDLFETGSKAYARLNDCFAQAFEHSEMIEINGVKLRTMCPTEHLLFLILHIYKHFINSGVGIRQICDIVMYANAYGNRIDWLKVLDECKALNAEVFAAALFDIGYRYLGFDVEKACYPDEWKVLHIDSEDLLDDLLDAGVYGAADMSRKHSGSITLNAVEAGDEKDPGNKNILRTVFPAKNIMERRYQYLKKYPFLLPVAWVSRIVKYGKETMGKSSDNNAMESLKIGNQRVELLKKYKIM